MSEARYLRTPGGWHRDARLYRFSEPVAYAGPYGPGQADHVIVSVGTVPACGEDVPCMREWVTADGDRPGPVRSGAVAGGPGDPALGPGRDHGGDAEGPAVFSAFWTNPNVPDATVSVSRGAVVVSGGEGTPSGPTRLAAGQSVFIHAPTGR